MKTYVNLCQYLAEFLLELEMFQIKVVLKIKTPVFCPVLSPENPAVCEILWKNMTRYPTDGNVIWCMLFACWITEAKHTHTHTDTGYVILTAFPRQQSLYECASMLHYPYVGCLPMSEDSIVGWPRSKDGWFSYRQHSNGRIFPRKKACGKA